MHVASVVLERSLFLDDESTHTVQSHLGRRYSEKTVARCAQRQIKLAFFLSQQKRINRVLKDWGSMMWTIGNNANSDNRWAVSFCIFVILTLMMDKTSTAAYFLGEENIRYHGTELASEKAKLLELVKLTEAQLFDRCKEIFHWKFKTRKGGKEACNPIRDGLDAFRGRPVSAGLERMTGELQSMVREYGKPLLPSPGCLCKH